MAAVRGNQGARYVAAGIGSQQQQWTIQILRRAEAPLRDALTHFLSRLTLQEIPIQVRGDIAWKRLLQGRCARAD